MDQAQRSPHPAGAHRSSHAPAQGEAPKQDVYEKYGISKVGPMARRRRKTSSIRAACRHSWREAQSQSELRHDLEHGQRVQGRVAISGAHGKPSQTGDLMSFKRRGLYAHLPTVPAGRFAGPLLAAQPMAKPSPSITACKSWSSPIIAPGRHSHGLVSVGSADEPQGTAGIAISLNI